MNRQEALRLTTGAFMINSGFGKVDADKSAAEHLHSFAPGAYPMLGTVEPDLFAKALSAAEIALAKDVWPLGIGPSLTFDGLAGKGGGR